MFSHKKFRNVDMAICLVMLLWSHASRETTEKNIERTLASISRFAVEKKVESNGNCKVF